MNIWIVSDLHLGHSKMIERGQRPPDFRERLVKNILSAVKAEDLLIDLGDLSVGSAGRDMTRVLLAQLNSRDVRTCLIRGNHDTGGLGVYFDLGFDMVSDGMRLDMYGRRIQFSHEPITALDILGPPLCGEIRNIHGHLHDNDHRGEVIHDGRHILISMEKLDYRPIPLKTVIELDSTPVWINNRFVKDPVLEKDA